MNDNRADAKPGSIVGVDRPNLPEFRELLSVFSHAFDDADSYLSAQPSDDYLNSLLEREDFIPLVAVSDGMVVGGLAAYVLQKFEQERARFTFTT